MSKSKLRSEDSSFESRRRMLKIGACGAMTNATFLSTLMHLKMTNALMADAAVTPPGTDYKAIVCLFFNGAIDSFNVLTPYGTTDTDPDYLAYYNTRRSNAAVNRGPGETAGNGATLKRRADWDGNWTTQGADYGYLNPIVDSASGKTFGLHPQFTNLANIYNAGHATFIANCGALVEPIANNTEYLSTSKKKPLGLFSHSDQQRHWQTAVPQSRKEVRGWGGRMSDLLTDNANANIFTNVSLAGQSIFLTGERIVPYTINSAGSIKLAGYTPSTAALPTNTIDRVFTRSQRDYASQTYADILEDTMRNARKNARDSALVFQDNFSTTSVGTGFPTTGLGSQLASVAKTILMSQASGVIPQRRQVFLVQVGGWDHHANLLASQKSMIPGIDNGLKAFYDFLNANSLINNVTTFSISDFSRTWSFNGSGSDHAWGANTIVMGGAVNGGRIYGTYPTVTIDTSGAGRDRGRGVIIPSTSSDSYHDVICRWFGIPDDSNLELVLPNIRKFRNQGESSSVQFLS